MYILGINAYHADAAAALIKDGELIAAVEEERFNRLKHCAGFPTESVRYCLEEAGIRIEHVDHIGISRDPSAHLHKKILFAASRLAEQAAARVAHARANSGKSIRELSPWERAAVTAADRQAERGEGKVKLSDQEVDHDEENLKHGDAGVGHDEWKVKNIEGNGNNNGHGMLRHARERLENAAKVRDLKHDLAKALSVSLDRLHAQFHNIEHHAAHLASSFYASPFERAALLSLDGFGDFVSTMWARGEGRSIEVLGRVEYPHSLGIVYTATTQFLGFPQYGDEGKVMGLAPYGKPRYLQEFREIIRSGEGQYFRLNLDYFLHPTGGVEMTWNSGSPAIGRIYSDMFTQCFGPPRMPEQPLTDRESDIAASLQLRLEEVTFELLNRLHDETGITDLGLSGGVAYNSVMNGKVLLKTPFRRVFIQPAAGDSGTALGVCYQIHNRVRGSKRSKPMLSAYTGPQFTADQIRAELEKRELPFEMFGDQQLTRQAAQDIADGLVVGWFQGRMEFGPRALGNRSIIVDPRRDDMKRILNDRVKKREPFRPFAPSILEEHTSAYFEQDHPSPTMLLVYQVRQERRSEIPAVTHTDGSGRLQTVSRELNPRYYQLISDFYDLTGIPVVLNTSFNENEPIVCTPGQALNCFMKTKMDVLYLGNYAVRKTAIAEAAGI